MAHDSPERFGFSDIIDEIGDRNLIGSADIVGKASPSDQLNLVRIDMPDRQEGRSAPKLDALQERLAGQLATHATSIYVGLMGAGLSAFKAEKMVRRHLTCFTLKHAAEIRRKLHDTAAEKRFQQESRAMFDHVSSPADLATAAAPSLRVIAILSRAVLDAKRFASDKRGVVRRVFGKLGAFVGMLGLKQRQSKLGLQEVVVVAYTTGIDCIAVWPTLKKYDLLLGTASALNAWTRSRMALLSVAQYFCLYRCVSSVDAETCDVEGATVNYLALLAYRHLDVETFAQRAYCDLHLMGLLADPPSSQRELIARAERLDTMVPPIGLDPDPPRMH